MARGLRVARRDPAQGQLGPLRNGQTGRDAHAEAVAALREQVHFGGRRRPAAAPGNRPGCCAPTPRCRPAHAPGRSAGYRRGRVPASSTAAAARIRMRPEQARARAGMGMRAHVDHRVDQQRDIRSRAERIDGVAVAGTPAHRSRCSAARRHGHRPRSPSPRYAADQSASARHRRGSPASRAVHRPAPPGGRCGRRATDSAARTG